MKKSRHWAFVKALLVSITTFLLIITLKQSVYLFPFISTDQDSAWLLSHIVQLKNHIKRPVSDDKIVICDLDGINSRDSIAKVFEMLESFSPKVIGCDIIFPKSSGIGSESTGKLKGVVESFDNVVTAVRVVQDGMGEYFYMEESIFEDNKMGNIHVYPNGIYIKEFACGDSVYKNFSSVVAEYVKGDVAYPLQEFAIDYSNKQYDVVTVGQLSEKRIKDKIVLVGDLSDFRDYIDLDFPVTDHRYFEREKVFYRVPGLYLHAYAISSILDNNWIRIASDDLSILIGFVFTFLLCLIRELLRRKKRILWRLFFKISQVAFIVVAFIAIFVAYWLLDVIINPLYLTIGIALIETSSVFLFSLWIYILKKIKRKREMKMQLF